MTAPIPAQAAPAQPAEPLKLAGKITEVNLAFDPIRFTLWTVESGTWAVEWRGKKPADGTQLIQKSVGNAFNVTVAPGPGFADVDVSVRFKPISGREDASGGIVFRFDAGRYYVIRANALEDNFRLYAYDGGRRQLASATVAPPSFAEWHALRVVAIGDHIQGYLNGKLLLDHHDSRLRSGRVGLWTKADSVTAFEGMVVRGK